LLRVEAADWNVLKAEAGGCSVLTCSRSLQRRARVAQR
jgi:hypothetical protein